MYTTLANLGKIERFDYWFLTRECAEQFLSQIKAYDDLGRYMGKTRIRPALPSFRGQVPKGVVLMFQFTAKNREHTYTHAVWKGLLPRGKTPEAAYYR